MIRKKRFFTLLELMIGLTLTAILLSFLSSFFYDMNWINAKVDKQRNENFRNLYVKSRLTQVIPQIFGEYTDSSNKKQFLFFTDGNLNGLLAAKSPSLVFLYKTGNDMDGLIAARALGRLYLDPQGRFCLATLPSPEMWDEAGTTPKAKIQVLFENVSEIQFQFYAPPLRDRSKIIKKEPQQNLELENQHKDVWINEWRREYHQLPPMMRITIKTKEGVSKVFAFSLPNSQLLPIYES